MGIYLNPDNENFKATLTRKIYVDKTMMIAIINEFMATDNKYLCVSRPRRFGKTIAGNMLSAYFSKGADSRALFAPYKIASDPSFESNLNKLNVIKIDINSEYRNTLNTEYDPMFSVEEVNRLAANGMPFRDAYKKVGLDIEAGKFTPCKDIHHTHEGSIGNLMNDQIAALMQQTLNGFGFERVEQAEKQLLNS